MFAVDWMITGVLVFVYWLLRFCDYGCWLLLAGLNLMCVSCEFVCDVLACDGWIVLIGCVCVLRCLFGVCFCLGLPV